MRRLIALALLLALLAGGGWWLRQRAARGAAARKAPIPTAQVKRQRLTATLPVNGSLESAQEIPVRYETEQRSWEQRKIAELCENNAAVQPGDLIFLLDTKDLIDKRDKLAQQAADAREALAKAEADTQVSLGQAESDVTGAQEALALARAQAAAEREKVAAQVAFEESELARVERELQRDRRLAQLNYIAETQLQRTEARYRQKTFDLEQRRLEQQDVAKRTAEQVQDQETALLLAQHGLDTAREEAESSLEAARIKLTETQKELDEATAEIAGSRLEAPAAGLAVIDTRRVWPERRPWRVGDDVWPGVAPVRIYNLEKMQVRCQIGEMDISRVHEGQEAFVLSPAQSGKRYPARVAAVEELVRDAEIWRGGTPGKKVFGALIALARSDPAHLRPGMTVDVEIVLHDLKDVLAVPIRAVFGPAGKTVVYRKRGRDFEAVPVTTGTRSDLLIEIRGGVRSGDRVAVKRPPAARILASGEGG